MKASVAHDLGKALAPKEIVFVAAYLGESLGDTFALENPTSLDQIKRASATPG